MDSGSFVRGYIGWNSFVNVNEDGYCYLSLVEPRVVTVVAALVGSFPTVASLLALPCSVFLLEDIQNVKYVYGDGKLHVETGDDAVGRSFFLEILVPASQAFAWPEGSLGALFCKSTDGVVSGLLSLKVGSYDLVKPSPGNGSACLEYNRMVAILRLTDRGYTADQVIDMVSREPAGSGTSVGSSRGSESVGVDHVPGPNWHRNRVAKAEQRVRRLQDRERHVAEQAVQNYKKSQQVVGPGVGASDWRSGTTKVIRDPKEEKLHRLRVERQIIQEERKLDKLKSPRQMVEDAIRQIEMAERCAKVANDSKVARWAADLSTASAESIARSSGSFKSYGSYRSSGVGRVETVATTVGSEGGARVHMTSESYDGKNPVVPDTRFDVDDEWLVSEVAINMRATEEDNDGKVRNGKYMGKPLTSGMFSSRPAVVNPGKVSSAANHLNRVKQSYKENTGSSGPASGYSSASHSKAMNNSFDKYMAVQVASERRAIEHLDKLGFIDENGRVYNQETAKAWVDKHAFIKNHVHITKTEAQIAKDAGVKESDVSRFFCLRREFKLK